MKPPPRKRATITKELQMEEYSKWTLAERQRLLKALEKYSTHQSSEIAEVVSSKSEAEVIYYLSKLKRAAKTDYVAGGTYIQRKYVKNIEAWSRFTHQLVNDEEEEYSSMIGKLLALYGEYNFRKTDSVTGVNVKTIYNYLSGLLLGVQLPVLPPLEAAIVLDLLKNVASYLAESDIAVHKKFISMNYQKHMFPGFTDSDSGWTPIPEKTQTILRRLLNEDLGTPGAKPPSPSHPVAKPISSTYQRKYTEKILPDGTKALVVRLERIDACSKETSSKPQSQESEISKSSLTEKGSAGSAMKETLKNSSTLITKSATNVRGASSLAEIIITNSVNNGNEALERRRKSSESSITSETVQSGESSSLSVEKPPSTSGSAVQQDPSDSPVQQIKQEHDMTTDQKEPNIVADPKENNVAQVSNEAGIVQPGNDSTNAIQVPNEDPDQPKSSSSGCIDQLGSKGDVLKVPSQGNLLHLPNGGTLLQLPDGGTLVHLPKGGTIKKEQDGTSVLQLPSGSTVQQGKDSFSIFQAQPNSPLIHQNPISTTAQKRTILSSLLKSPFGGTARTDSTNVPQTKQKQSILSGLLQSCLLGGPPSQPVDPSNPKTLQVTSKGLVAQGSSGASAPQVTSAHNVPPQETSGAKVFQGTTRGGATPLQLSNVSIAGQRHLHSGVKIVNQVPSVSAETQTKYSVGETQKRKLSDIEYGMTSIQSKRHRSQLSYRRIDTSQSGGSESEARSLPSYKPSISWLNPMDIPPVLVNLTKTKPKRYFR